MVVKKNKLFNCHIAAGLFYLCGILMPSPCNCTPLFHKKVWDINNRLPTASDKTNCDSKNERCLNKFPFNLASTYHSRLATNSNNQYVLQEDESESKKIQSIRTRAISNTMDIWQDIPYESESDKKNRLSEKYQSNEGEVIKKSLNPSKPPRGWATGGMPFSALYLNPRKNARPPSETLQLETKKQNERSVSPSAYQLTAPRRPMRRYSMIPNLYVSYNAYKMGN